MRFLVRGSCLTVLKSLTAVQVSQGMLMFQQFDGVEGLADRQLQRPNCEDRRLATDHSKAHALASGGYGARAALLTRRAFGRS